MSSDLQKFISLLEAEGELVRISVETDPILEIAAITDRVCKSPGGGKALFFEHPVNSTFQVVTNLFGSTRRVCLALGIETLDRLTERMQALLEHIPAPELAGLDRQIAALPEFAQYSQRIVAMSCDGRVEMAPPDLTAFPFLHSWPHDGSAAGYPRYITLPLVFTADPDGKSPNCGMYRAQLRGATELAIQWRQGSGAALHLEEFRRQGKAMPVAIVLGGDPAVTFSAMFPLPGELDEMTFAGFLAGAAIDTTACRTVPLYVPTGAEVVIEGYVNPLEMVDEGPFGNHTGFYSPATPAALLRVTAITHRRGAVIPSTVVGPPPMEDCWMAMAWERVLVSFLRRLVPSLVELHFPPEWIFHQSAIISLENPHPGMVSEVVAILWETPWFAKARLLLFVDAEADVADAAKVAWYCINMLDNAQDIICDTAGIRLALDATGSRLSQLRIGKDVDIALRVTHRWEEYGLGE